MKKVNYWIFLLTTVLIVLILFYPSQTTAQYFGRNKVRYESPEFKVYHTEHFDIYYYNEEARAVKYVAAMAERWFARHSEVLNDTLSGKQAIILYDGFSQFSETNVSQGFIGQGTGGFTEPFMRRVVLPFAGPLSETDHVVGHELVHAFQFDITSKNNLSNAGLPAAARMPLWFIEGMAEYLSLGPDDPFTSMWMREAALSKLPAISDLNNPKYFPYRFGQSLLAYISGTYGEQSIQKILRSAAKLGSVNAAIDSVLHISPDSLSEKWHAAIHAQFDPLLSITSKPEEYGKELIEGKEGEQSLNVSPSLSPDGKKFVFFSSRDLFAVDLYLANAKTGEIEKNIFRKELNTHLQNLEFINSTGTWSPDSKRFGFAAVENGRPALTIINVESGDIVQTVRFPKLAEIFTPAWSPDGKYIAFSAIEGGFSNLFLYDLVNKKLSKLTDDVYAELQPAWSPDGKSLVFVTDKFSTQLENLKTGNFELALLNLNQNKMIELPGFAGAKNINPQWSPDGKSIFFIANPYGISNIYRIDLTNNRIYQITNLYGGVTGITHLSPAISVAKNTKKLIYSVFDKGNYSIYSIDSLAVLSGETPVSELIAYNAGELPPTERADNLFISNLENPLLGLANTFPDSISDYHAKLSIVGIGQPSVAAGVDNYGTYLGGGITLFWSDLLGNYNLSTALQVQANNLLTNISGLVGYMNTRRRLNWGFVVQQVPYYTRQFLSGYGDVDKIPAYIEQEYIFQEINRSVGGILSYPFSQSLRVEINGSFNNKSFSNKLQTTAISLDDGRTLIDKSEDLPTIPSLNFGAVSTALVFDNSYMGATGPIFGSRYRLEVGDIFGSLNWINVLADYRQYFMPVRPFTIAFRILHTGRYGKNADDSRVAPLYIGYPELVRGYSNSSFDANECLVNGTCPVYDNLLGSKVLVGNIELRFPLFGVLGLGSGYYGFLPVEAAVFYDAGVAWRNNQKPAFLGGSRKPVTSFGAGLRMNLFGYAVAEIDYVHPFDRPGKKWLWQFKLSQGF